MDPIVEETQIETEGIQSISNNDETNFTKEQILKSKKYRDEKDLINALLVDGSSYALNDVDEMIEDFMKEGVK